MARSQRHLFGARADQTATSHWWRTAFNPGNPLQVPAPKGKQQDCSKTFLFWDFKVNSLRKGLQVESEATDILGRKSENGYASRHKLDGKSAEKMRGFGGQRFWSFQSETVYRPIPPCVTPPQTPTKRNLQPRHPVKTPPS